MFFITADQATTETNRIETVHFTFLADEFFIEYSIDNSLISIPVRGTQVPVSFGFGSLQMTEVEKVFVSTTSKDGMMYAVENIFPTIEFLHPVGDFQQEFPRHFVQVGQLIPE